MSCSPFLDAALVAWGLPADLLDAVVPTLQAPLWQALEQAWEAAQPPPGALASEQREPLPFLAQHLGRPRLQPTTPQTLELAGWHQQVRLALWLAAEALLTLGRQPQEAASYRSLLREQCTWIGQLAVEMRRRAGPIFGPVIVHAELRWLWRHWTSAVVTDLLFAT